MTCEEFQQALHDYFMGLLPSERRDEVDAHHPGCEDCGKLMKLAQEMTCKEFTEFLNDYIDGVLDPERQSKFGRHLSICPDCTAYLQSYRATMSMSVWALKDAMAELPDSMPPELVRAILDARKKD